MTWWKCSQSILADKSPIENNRCCSATTGLCTAFTYAVISVSIGAILLVIAIVLPPYLNEYSSNLICNIICLPTSSSSPDELLAFTSPLEAGTSPPTYQYFYIFNYTNIQEWSTNVTAIPIVSQIGPYTFSLINTRYNLSFANESDNQLGFMKRTEYQFISSLSNGTLHDLVTVISIPSISLNPVHPLTPSSAFETMTVEAFLFSNPPNDFITELNQLLPYPFLQPSYSLLSNQSSASFAIEFSELMTNFGLAGHCAQVILPELALCIPPGFTFDGSHVKILNYSNWNLLDEQDTGRGDINNVGLYSVWRGNSSLTEFGQTNEIQVTGTDGTRTNPNNPAQLTVWDDFLMTSLSYNYSDEVVTSLVNTPLRRYILDSSVFTPNIYQSVPLLNLGLAFQVRSGFSSPIFASSPYLFSQDSPSSWQSWSTLVNCTNCPDLATVDPLDLISYYDVLGAFGLPLQALQRVQLNALISVNDPTSSTQFFLPLFWYSEETLYGQDEISSLDLSAQLLNLQNTELEKNLVQFLVAPIGGGLILLGLALWVLYRRIVDLFEEKQREQWIPGAEGRGQPLFNDLYDGLLESNETDPSPSPPASRISFASTTSDTMSLSSEIGESRPKPWEPPEDIKQHA